MKKAYGLLKCLALAIAFAWIGYFLYTCRDREVHPIRYVEMSAPWYTGVLLWAAILAAAEALIFVILLVLKRKL